MIEARNLGHSENSKRLQKIFREIDLHRDLNLTIVSFGRRQRIESTKTIVRRWCRGKQGNEESALRNILERENALLVKQFHEI